MFQPGRPGNQRSQRWSRRAWPGGKSCCFWNQVETVHYFFWYLFWERVIAWKATVVQTKQEVNSIFLLSVCSGHEAVVDLNLLSHLTGDTILKPWPNFPSSCLLNPTQIADTVQLDPALYEHCVCSGSSEGILFIYLVVYLVFFFFNFIYAGKFHWEPSTLLPWSHSHIFTF